jgi:hypothetical protein
MTHLYTNLRIAIQAVINDLRSQADDDIAQATVAAWNGSPEIGAMHLARAQATGKAISDIRLALDRQTND